MSTTNRTGFRDLPLELRLHIYELALFQDDRIFINDGWPGPNKGLLTAIKDLGEAEAEEISRIYYRTTNFSYLFINFECGIFDHAGLTNRLSELSPMQRRWLNRINIICFFSTPERVTVAKEGINKWLDGESHKLREGVLQFTEKYWCQRFK